MRTLRLIGMAVIAVIMSAGFAACSDDDDNNNNNNNSSINPQNVFTHGMPKQVSDMKITQNEQGLVTKIKTDDATVTFEYPNTLTKAETTGQYVTMTIKKDTGGEQEETFIFDMEIGSDGFVKHCSETEEDGDIESWDFRYTKEGNLNYMKRSEGGNEITTITYTDGNITKTSTISEDEPDVNSEYNIYYTSDAIKTPLENKGCLMLFDATFGIDMDEMDFAYYAGLLGKATKNLPIRYTSQSTISGIASEDTRDFSWSVNSNGYPTKLSMKSLNDYTTNEDKVFVW
jgi:uncharacterized lipoprotein YehR (DUF1307 family)